MDIMVGNCLTCNGNYPVVSNKQTLNKYSNLIKTHFNLNNNTKFLSMLKENATNSICVSCIYVIDNYITIKMNFRKSIIKKKKVSCIICNSISNLMNNSAEIQKCFSVLEGIKNIPSVINVCLRCFFLKYSWDTIEKSIKKYDEAVIPEKIGLGVRSRRSLEKDNSSAKASKSEEVVAGIRKRALSLDTGSLPANKIAKLKNISIDKSIKHSDNVKNKKNLKTKTNIKSKTNRSRRYDKKKTKDLNNKFDNLLTVNKEILWNNINVDVEIDKRMMYDISYVYCDSNDMNSLQFSSENNKKRANMVDNNNDDGDDEVIVISDSEVSPTQNSKKSRLAPVRKSYRLSNKRRQGKKASIKSNEDNLISCKSNLRPRNKKDPEASNTKVKEKLDNKTDKIGEETDKDANDEGSDKNANDEDLTDSETSTIKNSIDTVENEDEKQNDKNKISANSKNEQNDKSNEEDKCSTEIESVDEEKENTEQNINEESTDDKKRQSQVHDKKVSKKTKKDNSKSSITSNLRSRNRKAPAVLNKKVIEKLDNKTDKIEHEESDKDVNGENLTENETSAIEINTNNVEKEDEEQNNKNELSENNKNEDENDKSNEDKNDKSNEEKNDKSNEDKNDKSNEDKNDKSNEDKNDKSNVDKNDKSNEEDKCSKDIESVDEEKGNTEQNINEESTDDKTSEEKNNETLNNVDKLVDGSKTDTNENEDKTNDNKETCNISKKITTENESNGLTNNEEINKKLIEGNNQTSKAIIEENDAINKKNEDNHIIDEESTKGDESEKTNTEAETDKKNDENHKINKENIKEHNEVKESSEELEFDIPGEVTESQIQFVAGIEDKNIELSNELKDLEESAKVVLDVLTSVENENNAEDDNTQLRDLISDYTEIEAFSSDLVDNNCIDDEVNGKNEDNNSKNNEQSERIDSQSESEEIPSLAFEEESDLESLKISPLTSEQSPTKKMDEKEEDKFGYVENLLENLGA